MWFKQLEAFMKNAKKNYKQIEIIFSDKIMDDDTRVQLYRGTIFIIEFYVRDWKYMRTVADIIEDKAVKEF